MDYQDLANGKEEDRRTVTLAQVRDDLSKTVSELEAQFEVAYEQVYLMAALVGDEFHESKRRFKNVHLPYGYLTTYVRQVKGCNQFTFAYRRPSSEGTAFMRHIRPTSANGYTLRNFKSDASHRDELLLCMETEAQFADLRKKSKIIKECLRKLREFKGKGSEKYDQEF